MVRISKTVWPKGLELKKRFQLVGLASMFKPKGLASMFQSLSVSTPASWHKRFKSENGVCFGNAALAFNIWSKSTSSHVKHRLAYACQVH